MAAPRIRRIAVIGAGNGGCAAAADLTRRGFEVRLFNRGAARLRPLIAQGGVAYSGALGAGFAPVATITTDIAQAMAGAELVALMVPTHAHEAAARLVAPHLGPGQTLLVSPGHTLLLVPEALRRGGVARPKTCETGTLPYICRMEEDGARVHITKRSAHQAFAAFPARETERLAALVAPVLPMIRPVASVLETVFFYTNAIHHPPATLCNAGRIEATGGDYCHYHDGITQAVGRLIDALDRERLAVAAALGCRPAPLAEHFFRMGYTTRAARAAGRAYEVFHQSEPDRWIRAPASLDHRFIAEDVPFGLVPLAELGRLAGTPTPTVDRLIHLASVATGRDWRADGLTLARMGLARATPGGLQSLLEDGFNA